ncbi:deoxynucleoside kinase, partial [Staphylococcus epidermidis]|uniref:deoxynucleoside kinase n=1 Tax=Staphylococcus epidermidis TaxID=1282 RepID=UPI001642AF86
PFEEQKPIFQYRGGFLQHPSIYDHLHIFPKMHQQQPTITPHHYHTYYQLFNAMLITPYFPNPHLLIYLQSHYHQVIHPIQHPPPHIQINTDPQYSRKLFKLYQNW